MVELSDSNDKSTKVVTIDFLDEDGNAVVPTSAVWTLVNEVEGIINLREQVAITPLASNADIVLTDLDLAYIDGHKRFIVIEAVYNGIQNNLTITEQAWWNIVDLKYIEN